MEEKDYHLSEELSPHHDNVVRALALSSNGELLSGSRDRVVFRYEYEAAGGILNQVGIVTDHPHWVNCIVENAPGKGFVTGSVSSLGVGGVSGRMCREYVHFQSLAFQVFVCGVLAGGVSASCVRGDGRGGCICALAGSRVAAWQAWTGGRAGDCLFGDRLGK